jgi:hypothetical protein
MVDSVRELARTDLVEEMIVNLRNGESVSRILERIRVDNPTVPGLFFDVIERTACDTVDAQCDQDVFAGVGTLYVEYDETQITEVWMRPEDFVLWERFLFPFEQDLRGPRARGLLAANLVRTLEGLLQLSMGNQNDEIGEFIARAGYLPPEVDTPLLSYTFTELLDPDLVPTCEIEHLQNYARRAARILSILRLGDRRPIIETAALPETCPFTDKGRRVPNIVDVREGRWVPDDDGTTTPLRISYDVGGETLYWVPIEYLP